MNNSIKDAFDSIKAEETLKENTLMRIRQRRQKHSFFTPMRTAAACLVLMLLIGGGMGGFSVYTAEVSYISIDVNPSIEFGINRFGRVVSVKGWNGDAALVKALNLKNKSYMDALRELVTNKEFKNYLGNDSALTFTIASGSRTAIQKNIRNSSILSQLKPDIYTCPSRIIQQAHKHSMSFGKYHAYEVLKKYDSTTTVEHCRDLSMSQIQKEIESCKHGGQNNHSGHNSSQQKDTEHSSTAASTAAPATTETASTKQTTRRTTARHQNQSHHGSHHGNDDD